jgi:hypothetical protein
VKIKLFAGKNDTVLAWLSKRVNFELSPQTQLIWAADGLQGPLLGAVGFGGMMGKTWFSISVALEDKRAALPLVRVATRLGFGVNEVQCAYINISSNRGRWIHSLEHVIGFREVDRAKDGVAPGEDLIMLKLTPATCRPWQAELKKLARMQMREVA